jgi:transposase-like protein
MRKSRKQYSGELKAKIALEAIKGQRTVSEIAGTYDVHPIQVVQWKKQALEQLPEVFSERRVRIEKADEDLKAQLYQQIGQLKVKLDWLKKRIWTGQLRPDGNGSNRTI